MAMQVYTIADNLSEEEARQKFSDIRERVKKKLGPKEYEKFKKKTIARIKRKRKKLLNTIRFFKPTITKKLRKKGIPFNKKNLEEIAYKFKFFVLDKKPYSDLAYAQLKKQTTEADNRLIDDLMGKGSHGIHGNLEDVFEVIIKAIKAFFAAIGRAFKKHKNKKGYTGESGTDEALKDVQGMLDDKQLQSELKNLGVDTSDIQDIRNEEIKDGKILGLPKNVVYIGGALGLGYLLTRKK